MLEVFVLQHMDKGLRDPGSASDNRCDYLIYTLSISLTRCHIQGEEGYARLFHGWKKTTSRPSCGNKHEGLLSETWFGSDLRPEA